MHSSTDPPGETTLDPWLDDPFPDYDTEAAEHLRSVKSDMKRVAGMPCTSMRWVRADLRQRSHVVMEPNYRLPRQGTGGVSSCCLTHNTR